MWLYQPLLASAAQLAAGELVDVTLTAEAGSFTITGQAATLLHDRVLSAESGSFVITGGSATLTGPDGPDPESLASPSTGIGLSISLSIGI